MDPFISRRAECRLEQEEVRGARLVDGDVSVQELGAAPGKQELAGSHDPVTPIDQRPEAVERQPAIWHAEPHVGELHSWIERPWSIGSRLTCKPGKVIRPRPSEPSSATTRFTRTTRSTSQWPAGQQSSRRG